MRDIRALFDDYASYHRTKGNKLFHRLGIPMIMLTLLGMLSRVEIGPIDAAIVLIAASSIYYVILDWRLGLAMILISVAMYAAGRALPMTVNVVFFVLGWIFQFIGHSVYEKKQPAFLRNFVHLLIGPLWILNDVVPLVKPSSTEVSS
ncbi:MAG TPA: Mpo1-like protein [Thermoanaerobaculia bacterium]